ncbi:MAG: hypothetical protein ACOYKA_02460 [Legionellaceae bacterium]
MQTSQKAQAVYTQKLIQRAMQSALENRDSLLFDTQGRVILDLALSEEEKLQYLHVFGRSPSSNVLSVSLDITKNKELHALYIEKYPDIPEKIRGSLIPLQQEFHHHLGLTTRVLTGLDSRRFAQDKVALAHQHAMVEINTLVIKAYALAIKEAKKPDGTLDEVKLIQSLDEARKTIFSKAHRMLAKEIYLQTGSKITAKDVKYLKHLAQITTSSDHEMIYTDQSLGQATWVGGSKTTAHDRRQGVVSDRQILKFGLEEDNTIQPLGRPRLQIRTPSLDVKKGVTVVEGARDVSRKLESLRDKYSMGTGVDVVHGRKAFTYNLYTSLYDRLDDAQGKNKQSQGAKFIFLGAHDYNRQQLKQKDPVFCFVQNIPVNGFGKPLGYGNDTLRNEATLMAEMALIYNLDHMDPNVKQVLDLYKIYLKSPQEDPPQYFSDTSNGRSARGLIDVLKNKWQKPSVPPEITSDPVNKVKAALRTMLAYDLHQQHHYSKLIQSLSVFIEQASIGGCKSGNERAQAINGRVALFEASKVNHELLAALDTLARARDPQAVREAAEHLKTTQEQLYNKHLQSAEAVISDLDQGAGAKVKAQNSKESKHDRNYAEASTLSLLHQKHAGPMQAHKDLPTKIQESWGIPLSFGAYLQQQFLNIKGGAVFVLSGIVPALLISCIMYAFYRHEVQKNLPSEVPLENYKDAIMQIKPHEILKAEQVEAGLEEALPRPSSIGG